MERSVLPLSAVNNSVFNPNHLTAPHTGAVAMAGHRLVKSGRQPGTKRCRREWINRCAACCVRGPRWRTGMIFVRGSMASHSQIIIGKDKESRYGLSSDGEHSPNYPPPREAVPRAASLLEGAFEIELIEDNVHRNNLKASFVLQLLDEWVERVHKGLSIQNRNVGCAAVHTYGLIGRRAPTIAVLATSDICS